MNMDSKWIVPIRLEGITSHHPEKLALIQYLLFIDIHPFNFRLTFYFLP
jgi:hypothetical protein